MAARFQKGLSVRQLAQMMGVATGEVIAWEADVAVPSGSTIERVSGILGIDLRSEVYPAHSGIAVGNLHGADDVRKLR